jgi:large subunit ribosomal protein L15
MNLTTAKGLGFAYTPTRRIGRGIGSGSGKTSGRGHKGAKARAGWSRRIGHEGGQMPLYRRIPKRGFNNKDFKKFYTILNVGELNDFQDGAVIDLQAILQAGLASKEKHSDMFKLLGEGGVQRRLTVRVDAITAAARAKIEAAGGTVEVLPKVVHRPKFVRKAANVKAQNAKAAPAPAARSKGPKK